MPEAETGKAVQVLDLLREYFGERGEHWTRDRDDVVTPAPSGRRSELSALQGAGLSISMTTAGTLPSCVRSL